MEKLDAIDYVVYGMKTIVLLFVTVCMIFLLFENPYILFIPFLSALLFSALYIVGRITVFIFDRISK